MTKLAMFAIGLTATLAAGGCMWGSEHRPVSLEVADEQGNWRLEGVESATLDRGGWQVRILESRVVPITTIPRLERLVFQIVNTSAEPLTVRPNDVTLAGLSGAIFLGPDETATLGRDETLPFAYKPGIRAPILAYPFCLEILVTHGLDKPESLKLIFY